MPHKILFRRNAICERNKSAVDRDGNDFLLWAKLDTHSRPQWSRWRDGGRDPPKRQLGDTDTRSRYISRMRVFRNLPVAVLGIASTHSKSSGS